MYIFRKIKNMPLLYHIHGHFIKHTQKQIIKDEIKICIHTNSNFFHNNLENIDLNWVEKLAKQPQT